MKSLYDVRSVDEVKDRLAHLRPESPRQWGSMDVAQAVAHCSAAVEMALGEIEPPRLVFGRVIGKVIKPFVLRDDAPMRRNSPTIKNILINDKRDLVSERACLTRNIDRFVATAHETYVPPKHAFFGPMTAEEWAILMYKHLDHHLRQFGA